MSEKNKPIKIEITQENYEKILEIAKISNSRTSLLKSLGSSTTEMQKLTNLLVNNRFDLSDVNKILPSSKLLNNKILLMKVVSESKSYADILKKFKIKLTSGKYNELKIALNKLNIDTSHFDRYGNLESNFKKYYNNEQMFIKNSPASSNAVKNRVLRDNLIDYKCSECNNPGEWRGKKLVLQLEHINGDRSDHSLDNLTFLCPNCHSVTETWCGKNVGFKSAKKNDCIQNKESKELNKYLLILKKDKVDFDYKIAKCNNFTDILNIYNIPLKAVNYRMINKFIIENKSKEIIKFKKRMAPNKINYPEINVLELLIKEKGIEKVALDLFCNVSALRTHCVRKGLSSVIRIKKKKIKYPPIEKLIEIVKSKNFVQAGKELGCSDNAIRKYLRKNGVDPNNI